MRNTPPSRVAGGCGVFQTGLKSPKQGTSPRDDPDADFRQPQKHVSARVSHVLLQEKPTLSLPALRFPNLFPPLKPETVARRTVEAVQLNQALLLLPWTMHALIILKSILPQAALEEIYKFSGTYTCMNTFKGRT